MIIVVAAAPGRLLAPLVDDYRRSRDVCVLSPLAAPAWLARVPGLAGYTNRRRSDGARVTPLLAVDAGLRAWARDRVDRSYLSQFALRVAIDAWSAREVIRARPDTVVCCSLAARRTFAAAKTIGARTVLVLDLPLFRALHRDLDRASEVWPDRAFLPPFRAPSWAIARQEAERVLADLVLVRGPYARSLCITDGFAAPRLALLPHPPRPHVPAPAAPTGRLRLAGIAAARHGIATAISVARMLGKTLVVRPGEGTEPGDLAHPHIATDDAPVDAVVCPAICETYPPEIRITGTPVIASPLASLDGTGPDPYDIAAFADAVRAHATR